MSDTPEGALAHIANAMQPLWLLLSAPELFTDDEVRECIAGAQLRLERADHQLSAGNR